MKENLNNKICIVGAGPSGMSAAWFLQKKGYTDITVLERLDRVGGKCNSPKFNGKYYEMGAGIGLPTYHETFQLMKEIEMDYFKPVVTGATYDCNTGEVLPTIAPEDMHILKSQITKLQTLIETKYPDIKKPGHENVHVDLMETFKDFCIKNELSLILKAWINPYTSFGYGYFDLVPAAYVLQYLDIPTMQGFISRDFISWKDGTESLWHKLDTKLNKKVRLCTNIKKVIRTENKVYVYTEFGKEAYDKIIFTSPLQDLSNYVDTTEEEANLFSKITYMDYKVFACIVDKAPHANGYIPGNMVANRSGHVMFFYNKLDEDNNIITFYTFGDRNERVTTEDCRRYLEEDLKLLGIDLKDVVMHKSWRYFPHVNSDQMKHGWYNKVEKLQGERNTFFAGEVMSFSDIEECVSYSKHLVNRFF
jgi:predicted NAD/FAD-dependent oxidoreductase